MNVIDIYIYICNKMLNVFKVFYYMNSLQLFRIYVSLECFLGISLMDSLQS
uniref:Predicted protein n=1 Tax=Hordeum vulgare subsp. vulgare TaxID=112509 RepID=F2DC28_HORVV|nr:predicted protein [Hordeum vulgare subsp. vulgare]